MRLVSPCSVVSLVVVCAALAACGGKDSTAGTNPVLVPGTGPVGLDDLAHEMAITICNLLARCNPNTLLSTSSYAAQCVSLFEKEFADQNVPAIKAAVAAGKSTYDATKVRFCLDEYPRLACDYSNMSELESACSNVWGGTVSVGGTCDSSFECASGTITSICKSSSSTCPGICTARAAVGEACPASDDCQENLVCDSKDTTCKIPLKSGDACGNSNPNAAPCGGITRCLEVSSGQYRCSNLLGASTGQEGEACDSSMSCVAGLVCTATSELSDAGSSTISRCQKPATSNGPCRYASTNPCPDGQFCPIAFADVGTTSSQCTAQVEAGQACTGKYLFECKGDARCYSGSCIARQRLGGTCVSNADCYSNNCVNAVCDPEVQCQP